MLHPEFADGRGNPRFSHHLLQRTNVVLGAQRIALGLHPLEPLGRTDQAIELRQNGIGSVQCQLVGAREVHLGLHLFVVHQRQLAKIQGRRRALTGFGDGSRPVSEDFQQGHGVSLDHGRLMLIKQPQAIAEQVAARNFSHLGLFARESAPRDLDQLGDQGLALPHRVDDAGTENRPRARRRLLHGGALNAMGWRGFYPTAT